MSKYIETMTAAEVITKKLNIPLSSIVDIMADVPSADVVAVKHGHWIDVYSDYSVARCSVCRNELDAVSPIGKENKEFWELFLNMEKYCPNCGAKMDGGVSE